jgi:hypothetical protein
LKNPYPNQKRCEKCSKINKRKYDLLYQKERKPEKRKYEKLYKEVERITRRYNKLYKILKQKTIDKKLATK